MEKEKEKVYIGIDIAKASMDIAVHATGQGWNFPNDDRGIAKAVVCLQKLSPALVVMEATGGIELPLSAAIAAEGIPVVVANPRQVRDFAKATGRLAKTDALDARVIAHFAAAVNPTPHPLPDFQTQEFKAIIARRRQIIEMITAEKNRLSTQSQNGERAYTEPHHVAGTRAG